MRDIKSIVANNISELRLLNNMTQLELAEKLNYSDKTISKWERAESSPDISVLIDIASLFGVTLDYLAKEDHTEEDKLEEKSEKKRYNRKAIEYISESGCWIIAIFAFIITTLILKRVTFQFLYFIYTLPVVLIVKLVFNSIWFNPRHNYYIISALMWSILASIHITFLHFSVNVALIYLLGCAGQLVIVLCTFINKPKKLK
ncbi:MAG: helix-turn-helix transcriptional regulator [Ruminococcaceae bacterium]|nr:helix-turn-helix transcriptional regulator [Oscillospiraceae bacterium]